MDKGILTPKEIAFATINAGCGKTTRSWSSLFLLGILAGVYIAFGAVGAITMLGTIQDPGLARLAAGVVFPVGLMLVVIGGAELFTGNNLMTIGCLHRKYGFSGILRNWSIVYIGNFIGTVFIALIIAQTGLFVGSIGDRAMAIAEMKVDLTIAELISRSILCNIIVVLAVWIGTGARDITGKILACLFPIMLFVISGYEHSIANMFFITVGKFVGAPITWNQIWFNNLIPVTIGNLIGGAIIIPLIYYSVYVREE